MGLQLPPGALMMKLDHQHIQGTDIQGCFGVAIKEPNGLKILTVGGISNLEALAADIYSRLVVKNETLHHLDQEWENSDMGSPDAETVRGYLRGSARQSIEAAVIFKQVLMDRAKEEAKSK